MSDPVALLGETVMVNRTCEPDAEGFDEEVSVEVVRLSTLCVTPVDELAAN